MKIQFCGAAQEVTGSSHLLEVNGQRILLDCGLFQGHRGESNQKNREFLYDPQSIDVVVLSHAHIDHSGNLPALVRQGYRGPIYTTNASRDLCAVMLMDAAHIQESDAAWYNRKARKKGEDPVVPLYTPQDALHSLKLFVTVNYDMPLPIANGVKVTFRDAGHVLGSASVTLDIEENGQTRRLVFSGDVGRAVTPLLRDPVPSEGAEILILESTYGNRDHEPYQEAGRHMADAIHRTVERKGKIIVPSFALERAQEVVYTLKTLLLEKKIPAIPVYVDSPLTSDITQIFRLHPECFEEDVAKLYIKQDSPFYFPGLTYIREVEKSKALNDMPGPMMIISASGMCEAGRILHHLRYNIGDQKNTILFVGFQAKGTLGRKIHSGEPTVKIFGIPHSVNAEVVTLNELSGHADRGGLEAFALPSRESCSHLFLVHGEESQYKPFAERLQGKGFRGVHVPARGEVVNV